MFEIKPLHVGIGVDDIEASIKWYEEVLNFKLYARIDDDDIKCEKVFLENNGFYVELFKYENTLPIPDGRIDPKTDIRTVGTKHICFDVKDFDEMMEHFKAKNVDIVFATVVDGMKVCFVRDNSKVLVEFMEWVGFDLKK